MAAAQGSTTKDAIKTHAAVRPCVFEVFHVDRAEVKWRAAPEEWRPPPCEHVCPCSPRSPAANKPKALSAACGDSDIFGVLQSHILPQGDRSLFGAE